MASFLSSPSCNDTPWINFYRPTEVSDIVGSDHAVSRLPAIARDGDTPHIILAVPYDDEDFEAIFLGANGDMLETLNYLQATYTEFRFVPQKKVFKVSEKPYPFQVNNMIRNVRKGMFERACADLSQLYEIGYSPVGIFTALNDALRNYDMPDFLKLEFLKEAGGVRMRIADAVDSYLLLCRLLAKISPSSEIIFAASKSDNHTPP